MRSGIADKKGEFFYKKQILKVDCSGQNVTTIDSGFLRGIIREEEKIQLRRTPKGSAWQHTFCKCKILEEIYC